MRDSPARVDLHVKILDDRVVRQAKAAGLDALVYAPHFTHLSTIRERAARYSDDELLVVPGREYFTGHWRNRKHVLAVDPEDPVPDFLTLAATMDALADQEAAVLAPHPGFLTMSLDPSDVETDSHQFDAVEAYSPKVVWPYESRMRSIAADAAATPYVSSYAHLPGTVGEAFVEYDTTIATAADLRRAIQTETPRCLRMDSADHTRKRALELAHLGYENTVSKFRRVVLDGIEPTNPHSDNYDDRFLADCPY